MPILNDTTPLVLSHLRWRKRFRMLDTGNATGFSTDAIGRWERGEVSPKVSQLLTLLDAYGCTLTEFADLFHAMAQPGTPKPIAPKAAE